MRGEFGVRQATADDATGIVDLLNARSLDLFGTRVMTVKWYRRSWDRDRSLSQNSMVVTTADERVVGYLTLSNEGAHIVNEIQGAVHPDYRGRGIGTFLLAWAEQRAQELLPLAPPEMRVVIHADDVFNTNYPARDLLVAQGYQLVRHFIHLRRELNGPPPQPSPPAGITLRSLLLEDWPQVRLALEEAFEDHWGVLTESLEPKAEESDPDEEAFEESAEDAAEAKLYFNTPGLCFVALAGDEVVGSCLCNARMIEFPTAGYVGSISVRPSWRGQGIGAALLNHAFAEFYQRGTRLIITDTDATSFTNAPRLYIKAGMSTFRQQDLYEKEIRPGRDVLKREP